MTTHPPDLYALIIRLVANHNGRLPATQGHLAHAAFLSIIQQVDSTLSTALHELNGRKPFTISPLEGFGHGHKGQIQINTGQEGWLRVTLLNPTLFHTFIHYFLQSNQHPTIRIQNQQFTITEILSHPNSHPLAGYTSLAQLNTQWDNTTIKPNHQTISLRFRSPTVFKISNPAIKQRLFHVIPDPERVFGGLASAWSRLTNKQTPEAFKQFITEYVVITQHHIETQMYQYRKSKQIGFTGSTTFKIMSSDNPEFICHLNRLADLAFYTGVGSKTTQGMGQVVRDEGRNMKDEGRRSK